MSRVAREVVRVEVSHGKEVLVRIRSLLYRFGFVRPTIRRGRVRNKYDSTPPDSTRKVSRRSWMTPFGRDRVFSAPPGAYPFLV